jgi:hypothetical protein
MQHLTRFDPQGEYSDGGLQNKKKDAISAFFFETDF